LIPIPIFYTFIFATGLGLMLSALTVFFRDIAHFYGVFIMAWMYLTPIFYPVSILPPALMKVMQFNPMYHYVSYMRDLVLYGTFPRISENIVCLAFSLIMLAIGLFVFYKKQDKFVLYV
jgi:ABC-2 type transport system permease protein